MLMCFIVQEMLPWIRTLVLTEMLPVHQIPFCIIVLTEGLLILQQRKCSEQIWNCSNTPSVNFPVIKERKLQSRKIKKLKKPKNTHLLVLSIRFSCLIFSANYLLHFAFIHVSWFTFRTFLMSVSVDLFGPEWFVPNYLKPCNFTFKSKKPDKLTKEL